MTTRFMTLVLFLFLISVISTAAQENVDESGIPAKVTIVIEKSSGDEVTMRLPYVLMVRAAKRPGSTQLRMGVEVPVVTDGSGTQQYRNVGTNIDCEVQRLEGEKFRVVLRLEQSSMVSALDAEAAARTAESGNPLFRTFNIVYDAALRDGESRDVTSATDPLSGEVTTVNMTLSIVSP